MLGPYGAVQVNVVSAGLALTRVRSDRLEVLLGHLGGPLWARRTEGAWSFPKGLVEADEEHAETARREFQEETGIAPPSGPWTDLGSRRTNGKTIHLFTVAADVDLTEFHPGTFELEWPPHSGRLQQVPEIDEIRWVELEAAAGSLAKNQRPFLPHLAALRPA